MSIPSEQNDLMKKMFKKHNFNLLASDMISLNRTLKDARFPECKNIRYPMRLPTNSIVIIFHNEPWSTLIRTISSILHRSPAELVEEIILVDDFSTENHLKKPLKNYIKSLTAKIRLVRTEKREGLIRARLFGAKYAKVIDFKFILLKQNNDDLFCNIK